MATGPLFVMVATISGSPGQSGPAINVWHVNCDNASTVIQSSLDKIRDFYTASASVYPTAAQITIGTRVTRIQVPDDGTPPEIMTVTPRVVVGSGGATAAAPQVAMVASWRTGFAGPAFRGRTYLGPLSTTTFTAGGGLFSTGLANTVQAAGAGLLVALATIPSNIVVYSRKRGIHTPITGVAVNTTPDTQRRRVQ